ncbi:MAG TPA: tetratricopeptide repeat protein [Candidatus Dormibacteraeota bacterium]|nr:tetratricopeptide repeat protein [Candidatus Dormibacteraeota bacterium]
MEASDRQPKFWSNTQTYTMAGICLILGVVMGYLVHAPAQASANVATASVASAPAAPAGMTGMPSAQDMKRMADKQAAPMLADLQKNPKDAALLAQIGRAYMAAQQYQTAQQYYEQSVSLKPDAETMNALAFVYYSLGDIDKAIATLHDAIKLAPKNSKLLFNLGMFEWHGKSDPKAAIDAWQACLKVNPNDPKRDQIKQMLAQAKQHLNIAPGTRTDKPAL